MDQLRTDVALELLTKGTVDGAEPVPWSLAVVVPLSVLEGEDSEVAEIPGWGPILGSTARDLAAQASSAHEVGVDHVTGQVVGVTTEHPTPAGAAHEGEPCLLELVRQARARVRTLDRFAPDVTWHGYRTSPRLRRFLEARDRTCTFPGCGKPASRTDKDHLVPWPSGPTAAKNMHCLCRHHHRAKQAVFTVHRHDNGTTEWLTRGSWTFDRRSQGY